MPKGYLVIGIVILLYLVGIALLWFCGCTVVIGTQNNTIDKSETEDNSNTTIDQSQAVSPTVILNKKDTVKEKPKPKEGGETNMSFGIYSELAGVLKLILLHISIACLLIMLLTYFLPSYLLPLRLLPKMLMSIVSAGMLLGLRFTISWIWAMKTGEVITDLVLGTILATYIFKAFIRKALFTDK